MITVTIEGPKKEVEKAAKQFASLHQTAGKVVKVYDASVNHGAWHGSTERCDVTIIKKPEAA